MREILGPLPHPAHVRRIVRNSFLFWIPFRILLGSPLGGTLVPSLAAASVIVIAVAFLVWFDCHRHNEHLFHANLGASQAWAVTISLVVTVSLEGAARILVNALLPAHATALLG
jgi:hypothetical protein